MIPRFSHRVVGFSPDQWIEVNERVEYVENYCEETFQAHYALREQMHDFQQQVRTLPLLITSVRHSNEQVRKKIGNFRVQLGRQQNIIDNLTIQFKKLNIK